MGIKTVFLIRHGETRGNIEKRYIGSKTDEPLCDEGVERLLRWPAEDYAVYSSPMLRCLMTAEILFGPCKPNIKNKLTEIDFGDFEGGNYHELSANPDYQRWIDSGGLMPFPNGESRDDFIARSMEGLEEILSEEVTNNIAIVCHGGNIMAIMSRLTGLDYYDFMIECGGGYKLSINVKETGEIDVISYNRVFSGAGA